MLTRNLGSQLALWREELQGGIFFKPYICEHVGMLRLVLGWGSWGVPRELSEWHITLHCAFLKNSMLCVCGEGWCGEEALCNSWLGLR